MTEEEEEEKEEEEEEEEEEEKLARLERLVANVDSDDQALRILGFHTDIYYTLEYLGLGAILQWSAGKRLQGIRLGNSHNHGAYP
jgi:hypothetical protein